MVASRGGTGTVLKAAITDTVSVMVRITPMAAAVMIARPRPRWRRVAVIAAASTTPGPASRIMGLRVLRRRLMSVLIAASKIKMGKNRLRITSGLRPTAWGSSDLVTVSPASTSPTT